MPDFVGTAAYLTALTGDDDPVVTFQTFDDRPEKRRQLARILYGTHAQHAAELARLNAQGAGIFVAINECGARRRNADVTRVRALFVDVDDGEPRAWEPEPSIVVASAHGEHAYWLVDDCELSAFRGAQQRLAARWGTDPSVCDLARVLRVPGYMHAKGAPVEVRLVSASGHRYTVADVSPEPELAALEAPDADAPAVAAVSPDAPPAPARSDRERAERWLAKRPSPSEGRRNAEVYRAAVAMMVRFALDSGEIAAMLGPWSSGLGEQEVCEVVSRAAAYAATQERVTLTRHEAASLAEVGRATIDRWVQAGKLATQDGAIPRAALALVLHDRDERVEYLSDRQTARAADRAERAAEKHRREEDADARAKTADARAKATAATKRAAGFADWIQFPVVKPDGAIVPSHVLNTAALLRAYGVRARYNEMSHTMEFTIPGQPQDRAQAWSRAWIAARAESHGLATEPLDRHIEIIASSYHPMRDWIVSKPWDGQDRVSNLLASLTLAPRMSAELAAVYLWRWMVTLARMLEPDAYARRVAAQGVLVLLGPQSAGKTRWIQALLPAAWVLTGRLIDPVDRDSIQQATSVAICELGELDGSFARRQGTMPALKAFVTRPDDAYRSAYARREEIYPRRTVFAASVNHQQFLDDETGNRRWCVIDILACEPEHHIDLQQLWAQAASASAEGEPHWLLPHEQAQGNRANERHQPVDFLEEELRLKFEPCAAGWMTYPAIARELLRFATRAPTKTEAAKIGEVLEAMGCRAVKSGSSRGRRCQVRVLHHEDAVDA